MANAPYFWVSRYRRLLVVFTGVVALACMVAQSLWLRNELVQPRWWHGVLAALLLASGASIRFWATAAIGGRKSKTLVTEGPYALTRNPLYIGSAMAMAGVFIGGCGWFSGLLALSLMIVIYLAAVRHEEAKLESNLGADYRAYRELTPRFLPRLTIPKQTRIVRQSPCPPRIYRREAYTALGFVLAAGVAFLVRSWLNGQLR